MRPQRRPRHGAGVAEGEAHTTRAAGRRNAVPPSPDEGEGEGVGVGVGEAVAGRAMHAARARAGSDKLGGQNSDRLGSGTT
jgi:hypothetical protein